MRGKPIINWFWVGVLLVIINFIIFVAKQISIGASTAFPYLRKDYNRK